MNPYIVPALESVRRGAFQGMVAAPRQINSGMGLPLLPSLDFWVGIRLRVVLTRLSCVRAAYEEIELTAYWT